jgi:Na+/proline symporter
MALTLYWRRATRQGALAGMLGGFLTVLVLYGLGWIDSGCQAAVREYERERQRAVAANDPVPERPTLALSVQAGLGWVPGWGEERPDRFAPLYAGGLDPLVWGLLASGLLGVGMSLLTRPDAESVRKYFPLSSQAGASGGSPGRFTG